MKILYHIFALIVSIVALPFMFLGFIIGDMWYAFTAGFWWGNQTPSSRIINWKDPTINKIYKEKQEKAYGCKDSRTS